MEFKPATIEFSHEDIMLAILHEVRRNGHTPALGHGGVRLTVTPDQHNGPDRISASVSIESSVSKPIDPPIGTTDVCRTCNRPIIRESQCWTHCGEPKPRHPAIPKLWNAFYGSSDDSK